MGVVKLVGNFFTIDLQRDIGCACGCVSGCVVG